MCVCAAAPGMVECMSIYQVPKEGITHVAATTYKDGTDSESEVTKLYYFVLPNDITSSM